MDDVPTAVLDPVPDEALTIQIWRIDDQWPDWPLRDHDRPLTGADDWRLVVWADPTTPLLHKVLDGLRRKLAS